MQISRLIGLMWVLAVLLTLPACGLVPWWDDDDSAVDPVEDNGIDGVSGEHGVIPGEGMFYRPLRRHTYGDVGQDYEPSQSRDSKTLYYVSTSQQPEGRIYGKPTDGVVRTQVSFGPGQDRWPSVSPNGNLLAFAGSRKGNYDLYLLNLTDTSREPIQVTSSPEQDVAPAWSPDGSRLVFSRFSEVAERWEIMVLNLFDDTLTTVGPGLFPRWCPSLDPRAPNFDSIVCQRQRERAPGYFSIWTIRADGTRPTQVVSSSDWAAITPDWSPDGERITFATAGRYAKLDARAGGEVSQIARADDLWIVRADGRNLTQLTQDRESDWNPRFGADGRIYFTSSRRGVVNVWSLQPPAGR